MSAGLAAACVTLMAAFNETFLERLDTARQNRTLLAYSFNGSYIGHSRDMLSHAEMAYHLGLQTNIPGGSTALVWTTTPFHFDFERNPLITLSVPGISSPALHFPAGVAAGDLEDYLRRNGVRFVILETNGYGVVKPATFARMQQSPLALYQKIGDYGVYLRDGLNELAARGTVLHSDQRMVVFELGHGTGSPGRREPATNISSL